jgi:biopolymer transport protein ExbB
MKSILFSLLFLSLSVGVQAETLTEVYQKELAFLLAQKRTMQKQLVSQKKDYKSKIARTQRKVKGLQDRLVTLTTLNETSVNDLAEVERQLESAESNKSLVSTTISQALVSLEIPEKSLNEKDDRKSIIFEKAFAYLENGAKKYTSNQEVFLADGKKVSGEVVHFGHVARFTNFGESQQMLMPVGAGAFKVYENNTPFAVHVKADKNPEVLPAFLYESSEKGIELKKEQTFMEMVHAGGSIAYVIVGLGLLAMVLMLVRGIMLFLAGKVDNEIVDSIKKGEIAQLELKLVKKNTPFSRVITKTLLAFNKSLDERENVIEESILGELNFLDKFGAVILVMAAVAPLLGLLGTVTGMISTFDIITEFGTGDPKMLSSGISEALITTKLGLIVAIPTLLVGNLFSGWSNKIKIMLEREALRLSNLAILSKKEA